MTIQNNYNSKLISIHDALALIQSGDEIMCGFGAAEPETILENMHTIADRVKGVRLWTQMSIRNYEVVTNPEYWGSFEHLSLFFGPGQRVAYKHGGITHQPCHVHNCAQRKSAFSLPRVFIGTCTVPDRHGYVMSSMSLLYEKHFIDNCDLVIMEVNPNMPRIFGDTEVPLSKVDYFVEANRPLMELPSLAVNKEDMAIGKLIAELVENGDTVQLGIGGIPNAVAQAFVDKRHLGIHTEMLTNCVADLVELGVVDGSRKTLHPGKVIGTFLMGSKKLYDYAELNPSVRILRGEYVNDPGVIAQNDNMVSINTAIQVDLTGQVCSEGIGYRHFSGTGGQNDTAAGAIHAKNGRSIIALYSTAQNGTVSTITHALNPGAPVTLSRNNVDYVVTEYGIACLRGSSIRQRVKDLIAIAHPKFRYQLEELTKKHSIN